MNKIGDFFKRIKVEKNNVPTVEAKHIEDYEIRFKDDFTLFKDEKEKIIQGAKELLEIGMARDAEDAIITCAVMFRGMRYYTTEKNEDGKTVLVLEEIAQIER